MPKTITLRIKARHCIAACSLLVRGMTMLQNGNLGRSNIKILIIPWITIIPTLILSYLDGIFIILGRVATHYLHIYSHASKVVLLSVQKCLFAHNIIMFSFIQLIRMTSKYYTIKTIHDAPPYRLRIHPSVPGAYLLHVLISLVVWHCECKFHLYAFKF